MILISIMGYDLKLKCIFDLLNKYVLMGFIFMFIIFLEILDRYI